MDEDFSTNSVNLVGGIDIERCVDMVCIDILDNLHVHDIEKHVPSWNTLLSNNWFHSLFRFLEYVLFDNGCALVWSNAKLSRLQERLVAVAHGGSASNDPNFHGNELVKTYTIINCLR